MEQEVFRMEWCPITVSMLMVADGRIMVPCPIFTPFPRTADDAMATPYSTFHRRERLRRTALSPIPTMTNEPFFHLLSTMDVFPMMRTPGTSSRPLRAGLSSKQPPIRHPEDINASITTLACPPAPTTRKESVISLPHLPIPRPLELRHRGIPRGADPLPLKHLPDRHRENLQIQQERPVFHVPNVQPELLLPGDCVPPIDLRPSGQTGFDLVAARLFGCISLKILHQERARPDQAHLPLENVEKLRDLVETPFTHPPSKRRQPVGIGQNPAAWIVCTLHRSEFIKSEYFSAPPWPFLDKEDRPSHRA